jgi:hypothetical protein
MTNKRAALDAVRMDDYKYDPWGTCMMHWFGVANVLYSEFGEVPADWEFRPGMGAGEIDSEESPDYQYLESLRAGELTENDLIYAGNVLSRWSNRLKRAGRDY